MGSILGGEGKDFRRKSRKFVDEIEEKLKKIYRKELEMSIEEGSKIRLSDVRRSMSEVLASFPDLIEQQIRDKLWTIANQIRREKGLKGKGKGKGKKE